VISSFYKSEDKLQHTNVEELEEMDYKGQLLAENLYFYICCAISAVAWVIGWSLNDFQMTVYGWAASAVLVVLISIPDWPIYNRNPVEWLEEVGCRGGYVTVGETTSSSTGEEVKDKKKSK
jgi:signal peptidase complex subunit 1